MFHMLNLACVFRPPNLHQRRLGGRIWKLLLFLNVLDIYDVFEVRVLCPQGRLISASSCQHDAIGHWQF